MLRGAFQLLILCAVFAAGEASANPYLTEARKLVEQLRYADALTQLDFAKKVPTDDVASKVAILDLTARCLIAEGQPRRAEDAYVELLKLSPEFELPKDLSPKILEVLDAARAKVPAAALVEPPKPPPPPVEPPLTLPITQPLPEELPSLSTSKKVFTIGAGSLAVAAGGIGTYFQVRSASLARTAHQEEWSDRGRALHQSANQSAVAGLVCFAGAAAAAVTAGILYVTW